MKPPFVGSYPVTQVFGANSQNYAQFGMNGHNGLDYGLPCGTPVLAAISGYATCLVDPPGFGNYIVIANNQFAQVITAHLSAFSIKNGNVTQGQQIGLSGTTGNSTGCHLHFGVKPMGYNSSNGYFGAVDPLPYLKPEEVPVDFTKAIITLPALEALWAQTMGSDVTQNPGVMQWITDQRTIQYCLDEIGKNPLRLENLVKTGQLVKPGTNPIILSPGTYKII